MPSAPAAAKRGKPTAAKLSGVARARGRPAGDATRDRMLDAAEQLFARNGYHGTSMREVAEQSEAGIALVTYHFGTKEVLFDKVVERRAAHFGHQRILALDAARSAAGDRPIPLASLVSGYVWPFVERSVNGGIGWKNYTNLMARLSNSPDWAKSISKHYDAVARQYLLEFRRALPQVAEEDVHHAFTFMVGAMVALVAEPGRVESLSMGKFKASNLEHVYTRLVPFLTAGFEAARGFADP